MKLKLFQYKFLKTVHLIVKDMSSFIKKNKDNNKYVKEIYEALSVELEKQRIEKQNNRPIFEICSQQIEDFFKKRSK